MKFFKLRKILFLFSIYFKIAHHRIKATLTQFLTTIWKDGALMGTTPEESFFVKCDRTTMTQSDIDNGILIVMVGISPTKPAEFVIFRFAQTQARAEVEEI